MSVDQPYVDGFDEETQKTLTATCPECSGRITSDGGEKACQDCGLIVDEYYLAHDVPRSFEDGPDRRRTGAALTPARHVAPIGLVHDGDGISVDSTREYRFFCIAETVVEGRDVNVFIFAEHRRDLENSLTSRLQLLMHSILTGQ
jgi:transcription initiation factor TFIIB